MVHQLLNQKDVPSWFSYPDEFVRIVNQGLLDFSPWIVLQGALLKERFYGLADKYPNRNLVPFARREDNDDVACWEKNEVKVVVIHDFSSEGFECKEYYDSFWDWLRSALEATIEYQD